MLCLIEAIRNSRYEHECSLHYYWWNFIIIPLLLFRKPNVLRLTNVKYRAVVVFPKDLFNFGTERFYILVVSGYNCMILCVVYLSFWLFHCYYYCRCFCYYYDFHYYCYGGELFTYIYLLQVFTSYDNNANRKNSYYLFQKLYLTFL